MPDVVPALGHSLGASLPRCVAIINRYIYRPRKLRIANRLSNQRQRCILVRTVCCTRMTLDNFGYHYDLISHSDIPEALWSVSGSSSALAHKPRGNCNHNSHVGMRCEILARWPLEERYSLNVWNAS